MDKVDGAQPIPLNVALDPSAWVADLDPAGRRRFWLLLKIVGDGHSIDEALDAAQKVERFLRADGPTAQAAPRTAAAWDVAALPGVPSSMSSQALGGSRRRLLDPATKENFALEAARNNDNRHLAKTFNLTVRQAHAIRVSLSRRIEEIRSHGLAGNGNGHAPQAAGAPKRVSTATVAQLTARSAQRRAAAQAPTAADLQAQRAVELALQEEFLKARPPATPTVDDVVRYLRQIGDVVVRADEGAYRVNDRLKLSEPELVERANRKRLDRHQPAFHIPGLTTASEGEAERPSALPAAVSNGSQPHLVSA